MRSALRGKSISDVEVTNVSQHGFWLLVGGRELFLPFKKFPWFKNAQVAQLLNVVQPHPTHIYWPDLDIDLSVESIEFPERFPLVSVTLSENAVGFTRVRRRPKGVKRNDSSLARSRRREPRESLAAVKRRLLKNGKLRSR